MKRFTTLASGMAAGLFALAGTALAIPPIMDRVPAGVPIVIVVPSIEKMERDANSVLGLAGLPPMASADQMLGQLGLTGLNKKGAMALVMLKAPDPDTGDEPEMVALIQADDYAGFAKGLNAAKDGELDKATLNDHDVWMKSIGGGFIAVGDDKDRVAKFQGKEGGNARHKTFYGSRADKLTDSADAAVFVDMAALKPLIDRGAEELEQRADEMAAAGGQENAGAMIKWLKEHVAADMDAGVMALSIDASGVSFDMTGVARQGSKLAGAFETAGKAHALLGKVPGGPFLAAYAIDMSNKGWSQFFKDMPKAGGQGAMPGMGALMGNNAEMMENTTGMAMVMGVPPGGLMSGLLTRTYGYMQTKDPAKVITFYKDELPKAVEKDQLGKVEYKQGITEVEGRKVDSIDITVSPDEGVPGMGQIMQAMFGMGGGPSMYLAAVDGGVVTTMSKSSEMMTAAIKAAKGENTLASDKTLSAVAEKLPPGRALEGYIGVKGLLDTLLPMAGMVTGKPMKIDIPEKLPPLAGGIAMSDRQVQATFYVPADVIKTGADIARSIQAAQHAGHEEDPAPKDEAAPKDEKKSTPKF